MAVTNVSWEELLSGIRDILSTDNVDIDEVKQLMSSYRARPEDWQQYAKEDPHRYTRNLVDDGNGRYDLLVVCWGKGHASAIHDHANSHCFMRILEGSILEMQYAWPEGSEQPVKELRKTEYKTGDVAYIDDSIGLHRIENPSHTHTAISLHLYCPPIRQCHTYEEQSGKAQDCPVSFYSKYGSLCSSYSTCSEK